jgi:hypothetical protein
LNGLALEVLCELFKLRDLPERLVQVVHVADVGVVATDVLGSLGNQADHVADHSLALLVHPQPQLKELLQARHHLLVNVVLHYHLYWLRAEAVANVEYAGDVDAAHGIADAAVEECAFALGGCGLGGPLLPVDLDLDEPLQVLVDALDHLPQPLVIVL